MKVYLEHILKSPYLFVGVILIYIFIHLFTIELFFHDKNIVAAQISKSISEGNVLGKDIPCYNADGTHGVLSNWAEEPPTFHFLTSVFYFANIDNYFYRFYGLGLMMILSLLLVSTYYRLFNISNKQDSYLIFIFALFQPYVFIFASRPMPDILSVIFLILFINFFLQSRYKTSFLFSVLAVTTKVLAIFPIFFFMLAYFLFSTEKNYKIRFFISSAFGLSIVPFTLWMLYLGFADIANPFISQETENTVHSGYLAGVDEIVVLTRRFWTRVLSYTSVKGISIPLFICFLLYLKSLKNQNFSSFQKRLIPTIAIGQLAYILIVASPQLSSPWYSFYFLPFYFWGGIYYLRNKSINIKLFVLTLMVVSSLSFGRYISPSLSNLKVEVASFGGAVKCDFHDVNR